MKYDFAQKYHWFTIGIPNLLFAMYPFSIPTDE